MSRYRQREPRTRPSRCDRTAADRPHSEHLQRRPGRAPPSKRRSQPQAEPGTRPRPAPTPPRPRATLSADARHRARRLAEAGLAHVVLELLAPDGVAHDPLELVIGGARTQRAAQVGLVQREQARPQHALGGQPDAVAVAAERLRDGGDEAELATAIRERVAPRGAVALAAEG